MKIIHEEYRDVRDTIHSGDIALYRAGWKASSQIIAYCGHVPSPYCHAGIVARWQHRLFLLETLQWRGGQAQALSQQVKDYSGHWDIYRVKRGLGFCSQDAIKAAIDMVGQRYGWWSLARAAIAHFPIVRHLYPPSRKDEENGRLPYCSMGVNKCVREGNVDLVPNLADGFTEPGDLANSKSLQYMFTLNFTLGV